MRLVDAKRGRFAAHGQKAGCIVGHSRTALDGRVRDCDEDWHMSMTENERRTGRSLYRSPSWWSPSGRVALVEWRVERSEAHVVNFQPHVRVYPHVGVIFFCK